MKKLPLIILLLLFFLDITAQNNSAEGTKLLFQNIKTKLTTAEKAQVFERSGLILSADKKQFAIAGDPASGENPFDAKVFPTDINNDGKEEIFIIFGNSYTSGDIGTNVLLFIKDKAGKYQSNFGFSGASPDILPTKNLGYPDLLIGGPGFEFPIWRWNGKEYVFNKKISESNLKKLKTSTIEAVSRIYVNNAKQ